VALIQEETLNKSAILWTGRLIFRQYIKGTRRKHGIKLYMLTEPNQMILRVLVYTGRLDDLGGKGHAANAVMRVLD
jgi:hypothetical protein